jgi:hypothetical protein
MLKENTFVEIVVLSIVVVDGDLLINTILTHVKTAKRHYDECLVKTKDTVLFRVQISYSQHFCVSCIKKATVIKNT